MGAIRQKKFWFSNEQLALLEEAYKKNPIVSDRRARRLCIKLGCEDKEVKRWFHTKLFKETNQPSAEGTERDLNLEETGVTEQSKESDSDDTTQSGSSENVSTTNGFFNKQQTDYLLKIYLKNKQPQKSLVVEIAEYLHTTPHKINNWFTTTRDQEAVIGLDCQQEQILMAAYRENDGLLTSEKKRQLAERLNVKLHIVKSWIRKTRSAEISSKVVPLNASHYAMLEELYSKSRRPRNRDLKEISDKTNVDMISLENWFRSKRLQCNGAIINPQQQRALVEAYQKNKYLNRKEVKDLANRENLSQIQAENWFKRQRSKDKEFNNVILASSYLMNPAEVRTLNEAYSKNKYISVKEIYQLADRIGVNKNQVRGWFNHKRHKDKDYQETKDFFRSAFGEDAITKFAEAYAKNKYPSAWEEQILSDLTGETIARVQEWFSRQRCVDKIGVNHDLCERQIEMLNAAYEKNSLLYSSYRKEKLAHKIGISVARLTVYFNRRRLEDKNEYRKSLPFNDAQRNSLLAAFEKDHYPSEEKRAALADSIGVSEKRVQVWFWRTRAKAIQSKSLNVIKLKTEEPDVKLEDMKVKIKMEPKEDADHVFNSEMKDMNIIDQI